MARRNSRFSCSSTLIRSAAAVVVFDARALAVIDFVLLGPRPQRLHVDVELVGNPVHAPGLSGASARSARTTCTAPLLELR